MSVKFLIFLMFLLPLEQQNFSLEEVRSLYNKAAEDKNAAEKLLEISERKSAHENIYVGYEGAAHMMLAKHVGNPFSKMSHFKKGKELYTKAIANSPANAELRFLRFAVQAETPAFLDYKDNIEEDKKFLLLQVNEIQDKLLKKMILNYLLISKELSETEKLELEKYTLSKN